MAKYIKESESIFGMANLNPQKAGLGNIVIWADHGGIKRRVSHSGTPRVKMDKDEMSISVTIEAKPKVLEKNRKVTSQKKLSEFNRGIEYVARNWDIFLKHYMDTDFSFDDEDLFNALRDRNEYR
jgi:hypothetical protein